MYDRPNAFRVMLATPFTGVWHPTSRWPEKERVRAGEQNSLLNDPDATFTCSGNETIRNP